MSTLTGETTQIKRLLTQNYRYISFGHADPWTVKLEIKFVLDWQLFTLLFPINILKPDLTSDITQGPRDPIIPFSLPIFWLRLVLPTPSSRPVAYQAYSLFLTLPSSSALIIRRRRERVLITSRRTDYTHELRQPHSPVTQDPLFPISTSRMGFPIHRFPLSPPVHVSVVLRNTTPFAKNNLDCALSFSDKTEFEAQEEKTRGQLFVK